jgi:hypothetical protein
VASRRAQPELCRRWIHSHEEDHGDLQVFRPGDHAFPPSRGRRCLDLRRDGSLLESGPGADDRAVGSRGRWTLEGARLRLFPEAAAGADGRELEVVTLESDRLVVRRRG